ncbi:MAG: glycosyltransferase family 4 protein [Planctomycetes bacterium]|nr:glycosyltransferase family 4 protein [Planctomycetota bacterium]
MKIAIVAAGAAGMYCGSCLRDNALAVALQRLGHDVTFIPTYTPLRLDEEGVRHEPIFLNGVQVYAEDKFASVRKRGGLLRRLLGSRTLLNWVSELAIDNQPAKLGKLTVSMLKGPDGNLHTSVQELVEFLVACGPVDVVHLSNSLLSGLAPAIKEALDVPISCGLTGEDLFLKGLPSFFQSTAFQLLRRNAGSIDRFVAPTEYYADYMAGLVSLPRGKIEIVLPGISTRDYEGIERSPTDRPPRIGFLARIAPEKGLHLLVDAFRRLALSAEHPDVELHIAGYLGGSGVRYATALRRSLATVGLSRRVRVLGTLDRQQKLDFLRSVDVFALPSIDPESKGLPALEAMASGVPVVVPDQGSFPELIERTGGGMMHESGNVEHLAEHLETLLRDPDQRRRIGDTGREAVLQKFSSLRMAEDTVKLCDSLLGCSGPRA